MTAGDGATVDASLDARVAALLLAVAPGLPDAALRPDAWIATHRGLALALSSFEVVQLVDLIEASFALTLRSADVVRATFASPAALIERLRARGAA